MGRNLFTAFPASGGKPIDKKGDRNIIKVSQRKSKSVNRDGSFLTFVFHKLFVTFIMTLQEGPEMARLSDIIECMIKQMIEDNNGSAVISRSVLAERVNCVPSQITYVLSTRFTNGQGYLVESRRGGGGQIRIARIQRVSIADYLMHTINSLGEDLSQQQAEIYLQNFLDYKIVQIKQAQLMKAALSDKALVAVEADKKAIVRMDIFKNMLISLLTEGNFLTNDYGGYGE